MVEKKEKSEYRYHVIPEHIPLLAFLDIKHEVHGKGDAWHYHNYLEFGYCRYGRGEIWFDEKKIRFEKDMFYIIPRNFKHQTVYDPDSNGEWDYFLVDTEEIIYKMYKENRVLAKEAIKSIDKKAFVSKAEEYPEIAGVILNICNELRRKENLYVEAVNSLLGVLLIQVVRLNEINGINFTDKKKSVDQISGILEYISENYNEEISTEKLAAMCHLSESHFRRIFKQIMDMSPIEYLYHVRIQMACDYMKKSDFSMETVAMKCGFTSISTFNRAFKKILDSSPYQWKKNLKKQK